MYGLDTELRSELDFNKFKISITYRTKVPPLTAYCSVLVGFLIILYG